MSIYDRTQRTLRHNFSEMTPSQRAKEGQKDYEYRRKVAESAAKAENQRREAAKIREEKLVEDNLHRLVSGVEVSTLDDMTFLIELVNNRGEEDVNHQLLGALDNYWDRQLEQHVNKLRREYMNKRIELDNLALEYFQRTKGEKRTCKKILATLQDTPYGPITQRVNKIVNGDKGE